MKGYKHSTTEQIARILELHRRPMSSPAIAAEVGVSLDQVRHAIRRAGLPLHAAKNGACYRHADDVRKWAAEGISLSEIARRIGTKHQTVAKFLARHAIDRTAFRQSGENNPAWKGGRMTDKAGYILVHMPEHPEANRHGYVREHRLVMERKPGRTLESSEVVHHKDDDPSNNDPDNLELFPSNGEHLAVTRKGKPVNWSEERKARIREACLRSNESRRKPSPTATAADDPQ